MNSPGSDVLQKPAVPDVGGGIYSSYQAERGAVEADGAGEKGGRPSIRSRGEQASVREFLLLLSRAEGD